MWLLAASAALFCLTGCDDDVIEETPAEVGVDPEVGPGVDLGQPDVLYPDAEQIQGACNAYDFRGTTHNCDELDLCDLTTSFEFRLACCECDPRLCDPPPPGICPLPDGGAPPPPPPPPGRAESCMACHNGAQGQNDYSGNGIGNPHPFAPAQYIPCTGCHGG
ncbi:MAG: hypothetical protein R3F65_32535, partial [bacterium]